MEEPTIEDWILGSFNLEDPSMGQITSGIVTDDKL